MRNRHKMQANEGILDTMKNIGSKVAGKVKQMGQPSDVDPVMADAKKRFVSGFLSQYYSVLQSEIEGGRVDPNITSAAGAPAAQPAPAQPAAAGTAQPAAAKPNTAGAVKQAAAQKQTTQNINNYVKNVAAALNKEPDRNKKIALTKELVNFMADRKGYPEWENALQTAKGLLVKNKAGGNMVRALQSGQKIAEALSVYAIHRLLEAVDLTWEDLGLIVLKENKKNGKYIIAEKKFYKLNAIFESIMLTEAESIAQFTDRFLKTSQFMKGIDLDDQSTKALVDQIEQSYSKDKGRAALVKLANLAFAQGLSPAEQQASQSAAQAGTTQQPASGAQAGAQQPAAGATKLDAKSVTTYLKNLKANNAQMYNMIMNALK